MTPSGAGLVYLVLIAMAGAFLWEGLKAELQHAVLCFGAAALCISLLLFVLIARTIAEWP